MDGGGCYVEVKDYLIFGRAVQREEYAEGRNKGRMIFLFAGLHRLSC